MRVKIVADKKKAEAVRELFGFEMLLAEDWENCAVVAISFPNREGPQFPEIGEGLIKATEVALVPLKEDAPGCSFIPRKESKWTKVLFRK